MQIQDFLKTYQTKSDEELILLAAAPEQLTSEARFALDGELSRRQISIAKHSAVSQTHKEWAETRHVTPSGRSKEYSTQRVGDFVAEALRTYHRHFWLYFKITAPAVIISTIAVIIGRNEGREIARNLSPGFELLTYRAALLKIWLATYSSYFVSWMAFSFSFGAICIAVEETAAGFAPSASHSFLCIRERLGLLLRLCFLLFLLLLVAEAASVLLVAGVFWVLTQLQIHTSHFLIGVLSYVAASLGLLVFSRFSLAVPALILDDFRVTHAIFRSDELTKGKWLTLAALLGKSIVGGYVAAVFPFWLASFLPLSAPTPSWFPWILTVVSIIGVTVVEPTMFVGFALLYLKTTALDSPQPKILTSQLA